MDVLCNIYIYSLFHSFIHSFTPIKHLCISFFFASILIFKQSSPPPHLFFFPFLFYQNLQLHNYYSVIVFFLAALLRFSFVFNQILLKVQLQPSLSFCVFGYFILSEATDSREGKTNEKQTKLAAQSSPIFAYSPVLLLLFVLSVRRIRGLKLV